MSSRAWPGSLSFSTSYKLSLAQSRVGWGAMGMTHSLLPQMSRPEELGLRQNHVLLAGPL